MIKPMAWMGVWVVAALLLTGCEADVAPEAAADDGGEALTCTSPADCEPDPVTCTPPALCRGGPVERAPDEPPPEPLTGVLEFRVAPYRPEMGAGPNYISAETRTAYVELLDAYGHEEIVGRPGDYVWLPLRTDESLPQLVTTERQGRRFVLLENRPEHVMLYNPSRLGWRVQDVSEGEDALGNPAVNFRLDDWGASQMAILTAAHMGDALAIILDGEVCAVPVVQGVIGSEGQITTDDADQAAVIAETLRAGAFASTDP